MKLGILQLHITADIADNKTRLAEGIIDLAHRGAELIVLQELHNTLYFCQVEDVENFNLAEPIPGPSTDFYGKLARDLGVVIVTSLFERRAPGLYHNTAVVIEKDGTIAGKYRKMHIPDDPAYYEKFYFTPGDLGFHPIQTSVGKLGVLVCWDQWYPEAARLIADGSGIDEQFGSLKGHKACCLGIPLVPTNHHSKTAHGCVDGVESQVARREVEFLVVGWVVGDVHLAVFAGDASVLFYHHGSVVIQACGTTLEERCHDYYPALLGYLTEHLCGWAGDRFGEVKVVNIFFLTEVE